MNCYNLHPLSGCDYLSGSKSSDLQRTFHGGQAERRHAWFLYPGASDWASRPHSRACLHHPSPATDIRQFGNQTGGVGTRSGIQWYCDITSNRQWEELLLRLLRHDGTDHFLQQVDDWNSRPDHQHVNPPECLETIAWQILLSALPNKLKGLKITVSHSPLKPASLLQSLNIPKNIHFVDQYDWENSLELIISL